MMKFIRTTHNEAGQWRPFSPAAWQFWWTYGCSVGDVIRLETALSFDEIAAACREYAEEQRPAGCQPQANEAYIAWCLIRLLEFGMVSAVPAGANSTLPAMMTVCLPEQAGHDGRAVKPADTGLRPDGDRERLASLRPTG